MNKKIVALAATTLLFAMPLAALAAGFDPGNQPNRVNININQLIDIVFGILWPIVVAFAIIMFVLAGMAFFTAQGDPTKIADARNFVLYGVIGMAVALLAFSLPFIIRHTLFSSIPAVSISAEATRAVTATSFTATWTTAAPETSRVVYGTTSNATLGSAPNYGYPNSTIEDPMLVTSHSVAVAGLTAGTYFYRVVSHGSPETVGSEQTVTLGGGGGTACTGTINCTGTGSASVTGTNATGTGTGTCTCTDSTRTIVCTGAINCSGTITPSGPTSGTVAGACTCTDGTQPITCTGSGSSNCTVSGSTITCADAGATGSASPFGIFTGSGQGSFNGSCTDNSSSGGTQGTSGGGGGTAFTPGSPSTFFIGVRSYDASAQATNFSFSITGPATTSATLTLPVSAYVNNVGSIGSTAIPVTAGTYSIAKTSPSGWTMVGASCSAGGVATGTYSSATGSITNIVADAGAVVVCDFYGHDGSGDMCPPVLDPCLSQLDSCVTSIQTACAISTASIIDTWCQASTLPLLGPDFSGAFSSTPPASCLSTLSSCSAQYAACRIAVPTVCSPSQLTTAYQNWCANN